MTIRKIVFLSVLQLFVVSLVFAQNVEEENYKIEKDVYYRAAPDKKTDEYIKSRCFLDIYYPVGVKDFATVVWFHGGGLEEGEKHFPEILKGKQLAIVAVNYRLSPKAKSPAYIDDAAAATAWVFDNIEKYGGNPNSIYVAGHSAGGYLALMIGLDKQWLKQYNTDANSIAGLFPISGQTMTHYTVRKDNGQPQEIPVADSFAPLNHIRKDAPPLTLITGGRDIELPMRYVENAYLDEAMKSIKHTGTRLYELEGFDHGSVLDPACMLILEGIRKK